jgi:hypothetical protein
VQALGPSSLAVYAMLPHKTALRKQHVYSFDFVDENAEGAAAAIAKALEGTCSVDVKTGRRQEHVKAYVLETVLARLA